ncbi:MULTISPECIES: VWA domain-containing protein [unclassified Minwuia]|jgi:Ca-activated chloride channel homolog|uniref:VWA domain-containing protein n=1 Tax=unclassified Minwuia TaxID=2618799 RepID=UPI00247A0006|nr:MULTISPECIES: VWA domain-containing protein [unclassified Minwuia]
MIELLQPWALLALPLPLIAWWLLPHAAPAARMLATESALVLLRAMRPGGSEGADRFRRLLLPAVGWLALVLALCGPVTPIGTLVRSSGHDVVIAIDLSASMGRKEPGQRTTAFDRYRTAVAAFLDRLPAGDRVALIAFGEQAYLIAPLTHDFGALNGYLDELVVGMPGRKTSVGVAIGLALKTFETEEQQRRSLLILSDGEDNAGALPAPDAALLASDRNVRIHAVGLADAEAGGGSDILRTVAEITGGSFSTLAGTSDLPDLAGPDAAGTIDEAASPLRRNWSSELLMIAAVLLAGHLLVLRRAR